MGGQSAKEKALEYGLEQFSAEQWTPCHTILKRTSSTARLHVVPQDCKPATTYSSPAHPFRIDEYLLEAPEAADLDNFLAEVRWRNGCAQVVGVRFVAGLEECAVCEAGAPVRRVFLEHVPLRLSQITDIPFPDNLCLLAACLAGFHYIFRHTHALDIREEQVCLDEAGRVKVWMHAKLAKLTPALANVFKTGKKSELALVRDIIAMVDDNTDHQYEPKNFKQYLRDQRLDNLTFPQAIDAVHNFARALQVQIPARLESVNDLFDPLESALQPANTSDNQAYKTFSGRGVETNETRMLESIPLQEEHSTIIYGSSHSPHELIKELESYQPPPPPPLLLPPLPLQPHYPPPKIHFMRRDESEAQKTSSIMPPAVAQGKASSHPDPRRIDEEEWRYYDVNGWLEIDPQILSDLKNISSA